VTSDPGCKCFKSRIYIGFQMPMYALFLVMGVGASFAGGVVSVFGVSLVILFGTATFRALTARVCVRQGEIVRRATHWTFTYSLAQVSSVVVERADWIVPYYVVKLRFSSGKLLELYELATFSRNEERSVAYRTKGAIEAEQKRGSV
jgi:hypothetical protein